MHTLRFRWKQLPTWAQVVIVLAVLLVAWRVGPILLVLLVGLWGGAYFGDSI